MNQYLFVGNLALYTNADDLARAFGHFGTVLRSIVITNPETDVSCGFGYVEMDEGADWAVAALDQSMYHGQFLTVHQINPGRVLFAPDDDSERIPVEI